MSWIHLADGARERAKAAAHEAEHRTLGAVAAAFVRELLDAEFGFRLECDQGLVGEAQLGVTLHASGHRVADAHRRAGGKSLAPGRARGRHVPHREHDAAGDLRERGRNGRERRCAEQRRGDDPQEGGSCAHRKSYLTFTATTWRS